MAGDFPFRLLSLEWDVLAASDVHDGRTLSGQSGFRQAVASHSVGWCKLSSLIIDSSAEVIRLAVMMYVRYPLSPRWVEDLLL